MSEPVEDTQEKQVAEIARKLIEEIADLQHVLASEHVPLTPEVRTLCEEALKTARTSLKGIKLVRTFLEYNEEFCVENPEWHCPITLEELAAIHHWMLGPIWTARVWQHRQVRVYAPMPTSNSWQLHLGEPIANLKQDSDRSGLFYLNFRREIKHVPNEELPDHRRR